MYNWKDTRNYRRFRDENGNVIANIIYVDGEEVAVSDEVYEAYWYDAKEDCITPLLDTTFTVEGFTPILLSNNMDEQGNWGPVLAAAEKLYEGKHYVICQLDLRQENPVAKRFLRNLYRLGTK